MFNESILLEVLGYLPAPSFFQKSDDDYLIHAGGSVFTGHDLSLMSFSKSPDILATEVLNRQSAHSVAEFGSVRAASDGAAAPAPLPVRQSIFPR